MMRKMIPASLLFICLFLSQLIFAQKEVKGATKARPFVLGQIDEIQSAALSEKRLLNIYLPEGYNPKDTVRYPVVYLLDGSADEDFIHIVGLYQFSSFPWVERAPKSIIVGIATVDRRRDFTYPTTIEKDRIKYPTTGGSSKFISFLEKELQPYIEKTYKTTASKTIIGQSLGGLLAAEVLLTRPALFNNYIIVSPSLWWDNGSLLRKPADMLGANIDRPTKVYVGVGKEGLVPGDNPRMMEVDASLLADKVEGAKNRNVAVFFDYLPGEDHGTILHQAVMNALRFLSPAPAAGTH